jgi:adenylyltransferase/sulfurtransferase
MKPELEERYSRQMLFPGVGEAGQLRLLASRVAIVGCGATGSALASLLARAGLGRLRLIDRDYVEPSNLQRQVLFDEADAADSIPKAVAACRKISSFNSAIATEAKVTDLVPENAEEMLKDVDLILDGTDNFETRYLINDCAVKHSIPWIYLAAVAGYAATMNIIPGQTACLACLFPEAPQGALETCENEGVLNAAVAFGAALAAAEAL